MEISLGLQAYDSNFPPADPIILKPDLHIKPCPICDQFGHEAVDSPEICLLCVETGYCRNIRAGTEWKDHPHYIIAQED
jgi:hypothetical protein